MTPKQTQARELQASGLSQKKIAEAMGVSRRTVRGLLKRTDAAVQKAMEHFGTGIVPSILWIKDNGYSFQIKMDQVRRDQLVSQLRDAFEDLPTAPAFPEPGEELADQLSVYPIFDAHIGLRAHAEISGEEMNLELARKRILEGATRLLVQSPNTFRAAIVLGGDLTHQTDDLNRTRRSGHQLDVDGRNIMTVLESINIVTSLVEMALRKHQMVEIYSVPGNHDPQNWETILIALQAYYRGHDRVRVMFSLQEVSVLEHGEVAVFIHHGDKRPPKDLCMFCSAEFPEVWGRTRYRVLMTGHNHHLKADEFPGIYWFQLPAVTVRDAYSAGGYKSHSLLMTLVFDRVCEISRNMVKL